MAPQAIGAEQYCYCAFEKGRLSRFQKVKRPHKLQTCLEERESGIGSGDVPSWHVSIITFKERIWKGLDGILPNHALGKGGVHKGSECY